MISRHTEYTNSKQGMRLLENWEESLPLFVKVMPQDYKKALEKLLPLQREDFIEIFKVMKGLPVTIRTLDPPLHEFLPHGEKGIKDLYS